MARIAVKDAALPYAPPGSEADVLPILQNTNYQLLMAGISRVTELFDGWFFQSPEVVAGDAAISTEAITAGAAQTVGSLELGHGLVVNPDGTFTVVMFATPLGSTLGG